MKTWLKTLTFLGLLTLPTSNVWGTTIRLGAEGGLSMASLSSNISSAIYGNRNGLFAGGILEVGLNDFMSLQLEGNYIQKGATTGLVVTGQTNVPTLQYDYFAIPLYLKFTLDLPIIKPFIGVGPYFGIAMNTASVSSLGISTTVIGASSTDFGISGMAGAEFAITPVVSLFVDLRYDMGFTDLDPSSVTTVNTRALIIAGGIMIGL